MSDTRERHRAFLLLVLLTRKGQALRQDIKPPPTAEDVGALQSSRLIERDKVNRSHRYTLTDKGWAHVAAHLGDPLPETKFAAGVLRDLLAGLKAYMGRSGAGLADIMGEASPAPAEPSAPPAPDGKELPERIRSAYLDIGGKFSTRVRLAALRGALSVDRAALDRTLVDMMRRGEVALYGLDYRPEITAADEAAAIEVGGEPKHLLYIDR